MSTDATQWAWQQSPRKATEKLILLSLADRASDDCTCWPSVERLCKDTLLEKKTVYAGIRSLIKQGLLIDTGRRKGSTGRVKVFMLIGVLLREKRNQPKNGSILEIIEKNMRYNPHETGGFKSTQKRNDSKNGMIPKTDLNTPENGWFKSTQKRVAEPKRLEPNKEPKKINKKSFSGSTAKLLSSMDFSSWPEIPEHQILTDWVTQRKNLKAGISQTVITRFGNELTLANQAGLTVDHCLTECVVRGWRGFKSEWLTKDFSVDPFANRGAQHGSRHQNTPNRATAKFTAADVFEAGEALEREFRETGAEDIREVNPSVWPNVHEPVPERKPLPAQCARVGDGPSGRASDGGPNHAGDPEFEAPNHSGRPAESVSTQPDGVYGTVPTDEPVGADELTRA